MSDDAPLLLWFRRDLRLSDHPALTEAARTGRPVIPVFLHDEVVQTYGAAPLWRLGLGVESFAQRLEDRLGARLILRRGRALDTLRDLVTETGATSVWWTRAYDPDALTRDREVKAALRDDGIEARSFPGHVMLEPWTVQTKTGGYYKVFTPMWKAVRGLDMGAPCKAPSSLRGPQTWPNSARLSDWRMGAAMDRGAGVVGEYVTVGEVAASHRLGSFIANRIDDYGTARDMLAVEGTSGLSENLTYGEISARTCWTSAQRAREEGKGGAETFLQELIWREFAYHLVFHTPRLVDANWRPDWDAFPWNEDARRAEVKAWKRGRTGIEAVDAAMREMFVTGTMHNRGRMIVASYLTKHLMCHWRIGKEWFEDCLIDWDPANNSLGWQWSAGSGPDATPFFRVFNPVTQAERFDPEGDYRRAWIAEGQDDPPKTALSYFDAIPRRWAMTPQDDYPDPLVGAKEGRARALDAYQNRDF